MSVPLARHGMVFAQDSTTYSGEDTPADTIMGLSQLNRPNIMEAAGSHGSIGYSIGASYQRLDKPPKFSPISSSERVLERTGHDLHMGRLVAIKGFWVPFDIGVSYGRNEAYDLNQWAIHGQWTLYENFAMPAIALRGHGSQLTGFSGELLTVGTEAVISYGFLRYFTIYGGGGVYHHEANVETIAEETTTALANSTLLNTEYAKLRVLTHKSWDEFGRLVGLKVMVAPPFFTLTADATQTGKSTWIYGVKAAIGL